MGSSSLIGWEERELSAHSDDAGRDFARNTSPFPSLVTLAATGRRCSASWR